MITLTVSTSRKTEFIDITGQIAAEVSKSGVKDGLLMVFIPHTTAAVTINEGADPSVKEDVLMVLNKIVPWDERYRHAEGNSPAHVKSSLIGCSELVAVENGKLVLGTWQSIFFCEFDGPRSRKARLKWVSA